MSARGRFVPSEVLLLGPGPSPVAASVRAAMAGDPLGHLDPEFTALMDRVQQDLRVLWGTQNRMTLPISGTGSAGMEALLVNLIEPGDRVVIGVHGIFGGRMVEIARRLQAEVAIVAAEPGTALDPERMAAAIGAGRTKLVAFVHAETSTGVLQDPRPIAQAARTAGALVVLDCVTSLGGIPVELDAWGIDAAFSGTQKCLSVPPGLSPISLSDRAMAVVASRAGPPPSWYLDLKLLGAYWGGERVYHHTAPVAMVYALAAGLDDLFAEGLPARYARHRAAGAALARGLEALGLTLLVEASLRTPMLTSLRVPDGVDELAVRRHLRTRHAIEIGGGLGPLHGRIWRIGLMGHGARDDAIVRVLTGLADALAAQGRTSDLQAALACSARSERR